MRKILVVDDDKTALKMLRKVLESDGFNVTTASDGKEALLKMSEVKFDILLTDLNMPHINGIELTQKVIKNEPSLIVILITAYGTIRSAVDAIKYGAFDYLTKPVDNKELLISIHRGLDKLSLIKENVLLKKQLGKTDKTNNENEFLSDNGKVRVILEEAISVAKSDSAVLITGERGTGKEYLEIGRAHV
jgi:DNA-binding NtrC family response regulator